MIPGGIVTTGWPKVEARLADMGITYDEWQVGASRLALGKRADGKYAATVGGIVLSIPRQVGKTFWVGSLLVALSVEFPGLKVIWTAHHTRTTTSTFQSIQGMVRRKKVAPHLALNGIRTANGEQEVRFANGSIIMFGAREHGFGRGMDAIDVEVFDEAQILSSKALENMVPATNQARHPHGALLFYMGTPPRPIDPGEAFTLKRDKAIEGRSADQLYIEFAADDGADPDDRAQWGKANPSYPVRTPLESMLRMRENLDDEESWLREALGIWPKVSVHQQVIKSSVWLDLADVGPADDVRPVALAVDMSHAREISVTACWIEDDSAHVEEVWAGNDSAAAVEWIASAVRRRTPVAIDTASPASSLIPMLRSRRVLVNQTTAADMAKACGLVVDRVAAKSVTHGDQEAVNGALAGGRKRAIRDAGGWGWDRRDESVNIAPIVSWTLALFMGTATKKLGSARSGREAVIL